MESLGCKIRRLRGERSQESFGALVGAAQTSVSRWESDKQWPEHDQLIALANLAGESVEEFTGVACRPAPPETAPPPQASDGVVMVPVYDLSLSAGPGAWCDDEPSPAWMEPFDPRWLRRITATSPDRLALVRVAGDSMEPTLHDGDQILLDLSVSRVTRDGIYGLRIGADLLVKRVTVDPRSGRLAISSDNQIYVAYGDVAQSEIRVVGRVVWLGRRV